ncbi:C-_U-editing enzyme APOBEC-2-like [Simochromis diagramma]|uniref:C->U-editing enzyme APOBEC-2-like n=1 Tax=Simochromis diagramma TaxID=43689 RepID=UPI001A7EE9A4|nr:C->U-editing enzyme APOBEC-2-like [Simochromis diagramma]
MPSCIVPKKSSASRGVANTLTMEPCVTQIEKCIFNRVCIKYYVSKWFFFTYSVLYRDRIDPFIYKFQFKNVEYSSGRNKTLLCYLVDKGNTSDGLLRGYLEDEHAGTHAEEAFFAQCLPHCNPAVKYTVTWYVSSSPCSTCATKIAELLKDRKNLKLNIFAARLFEWEEGEIQARLRTLHAVGCKLRVMKPLDFSYTWDTFVENEDQPLNLWEDCKENYEYYHERLSDILTP